MASSIDGLFSKPVVESENFENITQNDGSKKRLSVERIYQKKSQLEHILLRPDTYIGSTEKITQNMWVMDEEKSHMVQREITYVPGLYKIFDEILVNAADNKQRDPNMTLIRIDIDAENNKIKIYNNGKGIPVVMHQTEKMYVPTLIFGHLLTSSNYDDSEKKVTGGRNGYGAKLCNIFSTKFVVETSSHDYKKKFKQTWQDNMTKTTEPKLGTDDGSGKDYTSITFFPDLKKFGMDKLDKDIVDLFTRRAYDIAASKKGVKVFLNGTKLPIKNFKDYVLLFIKDKEDEDGKPYKIVHEEFGPRWEVAVTLSDKGFQQMSFVNAIATTKGGSHTNNVVDQLVSKIIEAVKKKSGKGTYNIKPFQIKSHIWVFINCLIENPTFDSQTKENMTLQAKSFGSKCALSDKFINAATKCGIVESVLSWMRFKAQDQLSKKMTSKKTAKLKGIPKLDDANDAGTHRGVECTLILTEGDSAKALAVAGLGVIGRDKYGVFPLKGKVLNTREASHKQIMENAEINNLIKILGLKYNEKYDDPETIKRLRYGKLMIMTDQDQDGSHIKGLLINFFHHNWPALLRHKFIEEFITPIVKVSKGKESRSFYSLPEFEEWKSETNNWHTWKVKYYKGLGTSTSKEAKEYFTDMNRHKIGFRYTGAEDDSAIILAFSKKMIESRKEWLTNWMEDRKRRLEMGLPEVYLYGKNTKNITYNEFINRELILFSNMDNERSIPSMIDGLKPGQRKILFTCFKRNDKKEIKVAQLAGSVAELSAYHHGENSLVMSITNLAQDFIGSNNLNLLQPLGQFGTRLHGGKDAASPRYIFTMLSPLAKLLFNAKDEPLLNFQNDDNQRIEPEWYCPIIPMVLVNGADGIGTGWSTKIHNYNPKDIVKNLKRLLNDQELESMSPWFNNYTGTIEPIEDDKMFVNSGEIAVIDETTVEITELPIRVWTQSYKEQVIEPMMNGTDKVPASITDYKEYHTDTTVRFVIKMTAQKLQEAEATGLHKFFKLQSAMNITNMVLFDSKGCITKYTNTADIMKEFYGVRLEKYKQRKEYLEGMLAAESLRLDNQARFIIEKIDGKIKIENKPKKELIQMLLRNGYDSDPVKSWKAAQNKLALIESNDSQNPDEEADAGGPDYNYILGMALWSLTKERKDALLKQKDEKAAELANLRKKTPKDLWNDDLEEFLKEYDRVQKELEENASLEPKTVIKSSSKGRTTKSIKKNAVGDTLPAIDARKIEPVIDPSFRKKVSGSEPSKRGKKKDDKQTNLLGFLKEEGDEDSPEPRSLAERLGLSPEQKPGSENGVKKTKAKKPKSDAPKKPRSPKKSPKKKNRFTESWSSESDNDDDDDGEMNMFDSDDDAKVAKKVARDTNRAPRRAATTKAKYNYDDDDDDDSNEEDDKFDSGDEEFVDNMAVTETHDKPEVMNISDDDNKFDPSNFANDNDDDEIFPSKKTKKKDDESKKPAKKRTLGKKADDGSKKQPPVTDFFGGGDTDAPKTDDPPAKEKKPAVKRPRKKKEEDPDNPKPKKAKKSKKITSDDDDDDDFNMSPKPKKSKSAAAKKKKSDMSDDSFDIDDFDSGSPVVAKKSSRATKATKYTFDDSDDDDDLF